MIKKIKKIKKFPLNFDDPTWSIEDVVTCVFLGDQRKEGNWQEDKLLAVAYVVGEIDDEKLSPKQLSAYEKLKQYLEQYGNLSRNTSFSPLIWCRIAIQYWLEYGGCQQKFISAMTQWVRAKNTNGVAVVSYKAHKLSSSQEIPLEVLLFDKEMPYTLTKTQWNYGTQNSKVAQKNKVVSMSKRSTESQVGRNLLSAVKEAVQDLYGGNKRKELFSGMDSDTGKFRYKGLRKELYKEIYKQLSKKNQKNYTKQSVIKAISKVACCRRSWPKKRSA